MPPDALCETLPQRSLGILRPTRFSCGGDPLTKSRIFHVYPSGPGGEGKCPNVQKLPEFEKYLRFEKIFFHILGGSSKWGRIWTNGHRPSAGPPATPDLAPRTDPRPRPPDHRPLAPRDPRPRAAIDVYPGERPSPTHTPRACFVTRRCFFPPRNACRSARLATRRARATASLPAFCATPARRSHHTRSCFPWITLPSGARSAFTGCASWMPSGSCSR